MRLFAWLLGSAPAWCSRSAGAANAYFESERRYATWWKREGLSVDFRTWTRAAAMPRRWRAAGVDGGRPLARP